MTTEDMHNMDQKQQHNTPEKKVRHTPWWVSILCAIGIYCSLKYVVPDLQPANETLRNLFDMGPIAAPVLTIPFLLLAAKQLYDTDLSKENDEQEDTDGR